MKTSRSACTPDFKVRLRDDVLTVWRETQVDREARRGRYSVVQCVCGSFHRAVARPLPAQPDKAKASHRNGVPRIERPKANAAGAAHIAVQPA